jgi:hypothetical protein
MERNIKKKDDIIQRLLKREVLQHLLDQGAIHYTRLYVHFDRNRKADIHAVLEDLTQRGFIEVDETTIRITTAGIRLLKAPTRSGS